MKCVCGAITSNLSGRCTKCIENPQRLWGTTPPKPIKVNKKRRKRKKKKPTTVQTTVEVFKRKTHKKCPRCTLPMPIDRQGNCQTCNDIDTNRRCPKCQGAMSIREGRLGEFWACLKFPKCWGTFTTRGNDLRRKMRCDTSPPTQPPSSPSTS